MTSEDLESAEVQWTSTVVLGDGSTAVMRPIRPTDAPVLAAFHERQSPESRYRRFFTPKPTLRESDLKRFTRVDFVDRVALVLEEHGEFIAWASYERLQNRDDAEVAFMVDDGHHGRGIATLLLEHLAAIARTNGIERFTASTLGDNRGMLAVFAKAGWPVHRRFDSGVIDVDFPLADTSDFIDSVERREHRADSRAIARLLLPSTIAVIGASDVEGSVGHSVWTNVNRRARVPVYPVNPSHEMVGGQRSFASVADINDEIALAVIAVPASALSATIGQCVERRVRGAIVITVPDSDTNVDELVTHARRNGLRLIGPASFGVASPRPEVELHAALVDVSLPPGGVAISMQSGTLASSLLRMAQRLDLGLSWFISLGNKRDVSANDLLQFWEDDEATHAIGLYTESLGNPRKFARIARRVSASKPIVAVRTGVALVGAANAALFEQTGVIEVPTVQAMLDTLRVFDAQPPMAGHRVAIISNSSSPTVLSRAALEAAGLQVADAPELGWQAALDEYRTALTDALADDSVDALLVVHAPATFGAVAEVAAVLDDACSHASKPVVAVMLGADDGPIRAGSNVPNFAFPEPAAAALGRLAAYNSWRAHEQQREETDESEVVMLDVTAAGALIEAHVDAGTMGPADMRSLLAAYGVRMPKTLLVDADAAAGAAHDLGYPVAVKAETRAVGRSAEAGIGLDVNDRVAVDEVVSVMRKHLGDGAARVYVQKMVPAGADVRVHSTVDDQLGPLVTVGLGGAQADVIADETSRLAPIGTGAARDLVHRTRLAGVLDEVEIDAVASLVSRVAQLVSDHEAVVELDLNPVIVGDDGCWVTDARILLRRRTRSEQPIRRL